MVEQKINYKKLKLKCGLEIHQQLDTKQKLFCKCSAAMQEKDPITIMKRKLHPVASELGTVDVAAQYEYLRNRNFNYQVFANETCLVELDESPPEDLNREALKVALQIAFLLNCQTIPDEIQVMRKTVIDGSNTGGFQRTMIVGLDGFVKYKGKKIPITHVALEEDAAAIVDEKEGSVTYRLNRLGVPLVEIGTGVLTGYSPEEIQDMAYLIGMTCRSCKVKKGIGSIRQDVNVSIKNGGRVEIKGVQELGLLSKVIELEVQRQSVIKKVEKETRTVMPDGTTKFMRPLPGASRMYPETDIKPIVVSKEWLKEIKENLPETWDKKLKRVKKLKLSDDLANQIIRSDYVDLFEDIVKRKKVEASVVANTFVSILKDLRREKVPVENLTQEHFERVFDLVKRKRIAKEAIQPILKALAESPNENVTEVVKKIDLEAIPVNELKRIIKEIKEKNPEASKDKLIGLVMARVRGKIDAQVVMKMVKK